MLENTGQETNENTDNTETKHNSEKANNAKHSKTILPGLVTFYDTRPWNEVGLFYNASRAHTGRDTH